MRVIAALSGGVDSAVAAARAVDAGHEVVGVHLALARVSGRSGSRGCCSPEDARDARRVADVLGIPYYVWDLADAFEAAVITDFVEEYSRGHTPNPCLRCNESIKFAAVLDRARALGFDAVCTGHYARIVDAPQGRELHRAHDVEKDQSYVLAVLEPDQLAGAMFPLGDSRKPEVRAEAAARGLLVADKPDSHDICFVPDGDTAAFLGERLGDRTAEMVDATTGAVVGVHDAPYALTIGQRRGLHLDRPSADGSPRYVVALEPTRVVIGPESLLSVRRIEAREPRWCGPVPDAGAIVDLQVRAHGDRVRGRLSVDGGLVTADLEEPFRGVAAGQALVAYDGTRVVGSATISSTRP
ncbi:MAG: tRNA 2-thiouridine(34) synthase MnmA [Candidatus Nanopelagicales bacterium]